MSVGDNPIPPNRPAPTPPDQDVWSMRILIQLSFTFSRVLIPAAILRDPNEHHFGIKFNIYHVD